MKSVSAATVFLSAILRRRPLASFAFRCSRPTASSSKIIATAASRAGCGDLTRGADLRDVKSGALEAAEKASHKERPRTGRPHPRNAFQGTYDMARLTSAYPPLGPHVARGPTGRPTVDWADPAAVRALNTALLVADYRVHPSYAAILPAGALVPPVPGRADYVHHLADALRRAGALPSAPVGPAVRGMDIGTGASCIYPLIAASVYGWEMIASDVNPAALASARKIVASNGHRDLIDVRGQELSNASIFDGVLRADERLDFAMCNPPFYPSEDAFRAENARKRKGLSKKKGAGRKGAKQRAAPAEAETEGGATTSNNFGGTRSELWCEGGEVAFVRRIVEESRRYADRCLLFSSLVSRKEHVAEIEGFLRAAPTKGGGRRRRGVRLVRRVSMGAGRKSATLLVWSFLDERERRQWSHARGWR